MTKIGVVENEYGDDDGMGHALCYMLKSLEFVKKKAF